MRSDGNFGNIGGAGKYPVCTPAFRVEKAKPTARFHDERRSGGDPSGTQRDGLREARPSQSGTDRAPHWTQTRLNPVFVAQILGQILTGQERETGSARTAYESERAALARACDTQA